MFNTWSDMEIQLFGQPCNNSPIGGNCWTKVWSGCDDIRFEHYQLNLASSVGICGNRGYRAMAAHGDPSSGKPWFTRLCKSVKNHCGRTFIDRCVRLSWMHKSIHHRWKLANGNIMHARGVDKSSSHAQRGVCTHSVNTEDEHRHACMPRGVE